MKVMIDIPEETYSKMRRGEALYPADANVAIFAIETGTPVEECAEKVGHWIDHQDDRWIYAKCSECGKVSDSRTNYCPWCGCKMQEVEE